MTKISAHSEERLNSESNIWIATARPDGRPHLTPVWFAWHAGKVYICIDPHSVKARNLAENAKVSLALEDGSAPIIIEGTGLALEASARPQAVVDAFQRKYDWNITGDGQYSMLVEITPRRILNWGGGG